MAFIIKEMKMKIVYYKGSFNKNCLQGELQGNLEYCKVFPKRPDCGISGTVYLNFFKLGACTPACTSRFSCFLPSNLHRAFTNF